MRRPGACAHPRCEPRPLPHPLLTAPLSPPRLELGEELETVDKDAAAVRGMAWALIVSVAVAGPLLLVYYTI